jgi:hypothetical protein
MWRLIVLGLCALPLASSCGKGGAEIVIDADTDQLTKVALFIGVGDAHGEPIQPAMHGAPYPASMAWARDRYNELDERDVIAGEPVVFQFQGGGDGDDSLGVVIAVGVIGDKPVSAAVKRGIDVPEDHIARYELALEALVDVDPASPLSLTAWESQPGSPKAGKHCVALYDKRTMTADAVVTGGDPDCDGWPTDDAKECQPNYYMSFSRPSLDEVSCLITERVVGTDGTVTDGCVLGGPPCRDGGGLETGCTAPSAFCLPKSVCNRCAIAPNSYNCARDISPFVSQYPTHINCKIYFDLDGKMCTNPMKALSAPGPDVAGHFCVTGSDNGWITALGQDWGKTVSYQDGASQLTVDISNVQPNCNFDIAVQGAAETRTVFAGLVAGMLDNGRGIAIPIMFEADPTFNIGCANQTACQGTWSWDLTEVGDQCLNTPVFPP